jgi:hypothetical protein
MCDRYRRTTQEEELARLDHIPIRKQTDLPISYNTAPHRVRGSLPFASIPKLGHARRRPAVGINFLLGERLKDFLPNHQRPMSILAAATSERA